MAGVATKLFKLALTSLDHGFPADATAKPLLIVLRFHDCNLADHGGVLRTAVFSAKKVILAHFSGFEPQCGIAAGNDILFGPECGNIKAMNKPALK